MPNNVNIVIFTIVAVLGYGVAVLLTRYIPFDYIPVPAGLLYLAALIITYYFLPSHGKVNEGYSSTMPNYEQLHQGGYEGDNLLKITPAKKCCLFPNQPGCENISQHEKDCVCCGNGFNGRPLHFEYTPESNHDWEWTRCDKKDQGCGCSTAPLTPPVL